MSVWLVRWIWDTTCHLPPSIGIVIITPIITSLSMRCGVTAEYQCAEHSLFRPIPTSLPFSWLCLWYDLRQYDLEHVTRPPEWQEKPFLRFGIFRLSDLVSSPTSRLSMDILLQPRSVIWTNRCFQAWMIYLRALLVTAHFFLGSS